MHVMLPQSGRTKNAGARRRYEKIIQYNKPKLCRRLQSYSSHLQHDAVGRCGPNNPDQIGLVAADNRTRANHRMIQIQGNR